MREELSILKESFYSSMSGEDGDQRAKLNQPRTDNKAQLQKRGLTIGTCSVCFTLTYTSVFRFIFVSYTWYYFIFIFCRFGIFFSFF